LSLFLALSAVKHGTKNPIFKFNQMKNDCAPKKKTVGRGVKGEVFRYFFSGAKSDKIEIKSVT